MKRWLAGIVALAFSGAASASLVHDWTKQFDGAGSGFDGNDKLVGDASGSVYLVHEPVKAATNSRDVTLTKFAPDGTVAWERTLPNSSPTNERSGQVAANANGSTIAYTGILRVGSEDRAVISAAKSDGTVLFTTDLGPVFRLHSVHALSGSDGFLVTMESAGFLGQPVVQVARVSSTGARLWKEEFAANHAVPHTLVSAAADGSRIVLGGYYEVPQREGTLDYPFLVSFDLNGEEVWHDTLVPASGRVVGIQLFGTTTVAQTRPDLDSDPSYLLKYGPSGSFIWRSRFNPIEGSEPIAGMGNANAYVALNSETAWGAVRIRPTSSYPFVYGMFPIAGTDRRAQAVTHDNSGVIVSGRALQTNWRPAMAKYDDLTRNEVWSYISATPATFGRAFVLPNGRVVLMGRTGDNQIVLHRFTQAIAVQKVETSVASGNASVKPKVKVTLAYPAPTGGVTVALSTNSTRFTLPANLVVPAGALSAEAQSNILPVAANTVVRVSATTGTVSKQTDYTILPPKVQSVSVTPASAYGGDPYTITFTLDSKPPASFPCTVTAPAALGLPTSVTFSNFESLTLPRTAPPTAADTNHVIKLSKNGITKQTTFKTLRPVLQSVYLNNNWSTGTMTQDGGDPLKIKVNLRGKSSAPVPVTMTEAMANLVGGNFSVPAGQSSVEVNRTTTLPSAMVVTGTVSFSVFGQTRTGTLAILRARATTLTGSSNPLHSVPSFYTVSLKKPAPSGGVKVTLSFAPGLAKLGITSSTFTIPAGASSRTFGILPPKPTSQVKGTLLATISSLSSAGRVITINP